MKRHGFTLIEILVTLAVIGVILGVMAPRWESGAGRVLADEAARLALTLEQGVDEAQATGTPLAVGFDETGYRFYRADGGTWVEAEGMRWGNRRFALPVTVERVDPAFRYERLTLTWLGPGAPSTVVVTLMADEQRATVRLSPVGVAEVSIP